MLKPKELLIKFQNYLIEEGFQPGDKLDGEINLAKRFGVSRGTIREIIIHLSLTGILERGTNRGTYLKHPDVKDIEEDLAFRFQVANLGFEELKETRLCLELAIVPLIIKRITPQAVDRLRELIQKMEDCVDTPEKADKYDHQFHLALMEVSGNRLLKMFSQVMVLLFNKKYRGKFLTPEAAMHSVSTHRLILDALYSGNREEAERLIKEHISPT